MKKQEFFFIVLKNRLYQSIIMNSNRGEIMVKNPLKNYTFWFKLFGGVVLLAFAIIMFVSNLKDKETSLASKIVVGVTGGIVLIFALYRLFPLFKTVEKTGTKWLCVLEILVDVIAGALLITGGFNFKDEEAKYTNFVISNYRYFLGAVLYLRGLVYFITSIIFGEKSDGKQFIANLVAITFGVAVVCLEKFNAYELSWAMIVMSVISGGYLVGEGGYHYINYRNQFKENRDSKNKTKETADEALDGIGEKSKDNVAEKDVEVNILNNTEDEIGQNSDMPN